MSNDPLYLLRELIRNLAYIADELASAYGHDEVDALAMALHSLADEGSR